MTGPGPLVFTATCPCGREASWTATPVDIGRPATTVDGVHLLHPNHRGARAMSESEYHGLPNYPSGWSSYDWAAVFDGTDNESRPEWSTTTFPPQPVEPISPDHVAEIENVWTQCNEDYADSEIVALIRLTDGRYAAVTAWSDSTGWGCRDATYWKIAPDRDSAIRHGLDNEGRTRLGLALPDTSEERK